MFRLWKVNPGWLRGCIDDREGSCLLLLLMPEGLVKPLFSLQRGLKLKCERFFFWFLVSSFLTLTTRL